MAAYFNIFLIVMALLALAVYIALHYFEAGYGYLFNRKYGFPIPNRIGWVLMECPVFIAMTVLWLLSDRTWEAAPLALLILFQGHYLQRAFIFPLLIRGNSKIAGRYRGNGHALQYAQRPDARRLDLLHLSCRLLRRLVLQSTIFHIGAALFVAGMVINLHSDYIIRHLRKPGDTRHYIPRGGMFPLRFVGQLFRRADRMGGLRHRFVVMGRAVFAWWTFANLAPAAASLYKRYEK